jgi:hypothetical protein
MAAGVVAQVSLRRLRGFWFLVAAALQLFHYRTAVGQTLEGASDGDLVVPVCFMLPMFGAQPEDGGLAPLAQLGLLIFTPPTLLALQHVNSANCSVLGDYSCEVLLNAGGRRVRLKPYLYNMESLAPGAAPPLVQMCASTDASVVTAAFTSAQSSLVASFIGGLGTRPPALSTVSPSVLPSLFTNFLLSPPVQVGS